MSDMLHRSSTLTMSDHPPAPAAAPSDADLTALIERCAMAVERAERHDGPPPSSAGDLDDAVEALRILQRDRQQHAAATAATVQAAYKEGWMVNAIATDEHDADQGRLGEYAETDWKRSAAIKTDGTTTLAALLAEAREKALREAVEVANKWTVFGVQHSNAEEDAAYDTATAIAEAIEALIPTPSPERGEAQQQGGETNGE